MIRAETLAFSAFHRLEPNVRKIENAIAGIHQNRMKLLNRENWAPGLWRAVIWRSLTVLTCPCCIPLWIALLSGTAAGALLSNNLFITVALFLVLFLVCFWKALRSYDQDSNSSPTEERNDSH